jgi:hypothetical protein
MCAFLDEDGVADLEFRFLGTAYDNLGYHAEILPLTSALITSREKVESRFACLETILGV